MACAYTGAAVPVEVFMEQHQIAPVRIGLEFFDLTKYRAPAFPVAHEDTAEPARKLGCHLPQRQQDCGASGELDLEIVAKVVVEPLQRLDEQKVRWEPDRTSPVRIATNSPTATPLAIAFELAKDDPAYEDVASKFWEHFLMTY